MSLPAMSSWEKLLYILLAISIPVSQQHGAVKIKFGNDTNRPVRDPEDPTLGRRSLLTSADPLCQTVGSSAGALAAHRLTLTGALTRGEPIPSTVLIDLKSFVTMVATAAIQGLEDLGCPTEVLQPAAEEMCMAVVCAAGGKSVTRETSLAMALKLTGVINFVPVFTKFVPANYKKGCSEANYNFRLPGGKEFQYNPRYHVNLMVNGIQREIMQIHQILVKNNAKPTIIEPSAPPVEKEYVTAAIKGAVLSSYVSKIITQTGTISNKPGPGYFDVTEFLNQIMPRIVSKLSIPSAQEATRIYNLAFKMTLYWIINNFQLTKATEVGIITGNTLANLGLAGFFPRTTKLKTNNAPVKAAGVYITFPSVKNDIQAVWFILENEIPYHQILRDYEALSPDGIIEVSDEVIRLEIEPVPGNAVESTNALNAMEQSQEGVGVGCLPRPENWFSQDVEAQNTTAKVNAVLLGTMSVIVGAHAGQIMKSIGIVTTAEQGYSDLVKVDAYSYLQDIIQKLVSTLMRVFPMTMDTGFYIVNAAFKTAKMVLNVENISEKRLDQNAYMSLGLKYFQLMKFHPAIQNEKWDLWPMPNKIQVLDLWVKPILDVDLNASINHKVIEQCALNGALILQSILTIFKFHDPDLNFYKIKSLPKVTDSIFQWEPSEVLSFLYDPPTIDGVPSSPKLLLESPKEPLSCPDHFMCPTETCRKPPCGHYVCTKNQGWCYFPKNITCPGSIQCPIQLQIQDETLTCPEDKRCPIVNIHCPGSFECPDGNVKCPGDVNCPLKIKCPGSMCPSRYERRPQMLIPCPGHYLCKKQPLPNQLVCQSDITCTYPDALTQNTDLAAAIKAAGDVIANSVDKKEFNININNSAVSQINMVGPGTDDNDGTSTSASASAATSTSSKDSTAAASAAAAANETPIPSSTQGHPSAVGAASKEPSPLSRASASAAAAAASSSRGKSSSSAAASASSTGRKKGKSSSSAASAASEKGKKNGGSSSAAASAASDNDDKNGASSSSAASAASDNDDKKGGSSSAAASAASDKDDKDGASSSAAAAASDTDDKNGESPSSAASAASDNDDKSGGSSSAAASAASDHDDKKGGSSSAAASAASDNDGKNGASSSSAAAAASSTDDKKKIKCRNKKTTGKPWFY